MDVKCREGAWVAMQVRIMGKTSGVGRCVDVLEAIGK